LVVRSERQALDAAGLRLGVAELAARDPALAGIVRRHGQPPLWPREPGFETLVRIVLEQQVTLDSGRAAFERLVRAAGRASPEAIAALDEAALRAAGITRQKSRYLVGLARMIVAGGLDLETIAVLADDEARVALMSVPGIGSWTADVYLLLALRRPDAWPSGDIALAAAARDALGLDRRPDAFELTRLAEAWRPWRAVAARLLWHDYLSRRAAARSGAAPGALPRTQEPG
jgi:DNA-3-methyladenine glycosylase II